MEKLRSQPDAPLAHVLTSPLMVSLAGTGYAAPRSDPAELLGFRDQAAIEHHLLEAFIPAAYHDAPPEPGTPVTSAQRQYSPDQARKWLTFLARHLDTLPTRDPASPARDLAWWQLVEAIPRRTCGISVGLTAGLLFRIANVIGGASVPGLSYTLRTQPQPLHVELRFRGGLVPFLRQFVTGLGIGLVVGLGMGLPYQAALMTGPVFGFALAAQVWLDKPADVTQVSSPRIVLKQDRTAAFLFGLVVALPLGLTGGLVLGFPSGLAFGVIGGVVAVLASALAGAVAAGVLDGRAYGLVGRCMFAFTGAIVGGLGFEPTDPAAHAVLGPAYGVTFGLAIGFSTMPTAGKCSGSPARPTSSAMLACKITSPADRHRCECREPRPC